MSELDSFILGLLIAALFVYMLLSRFAENANSEHDIHAGGGDDFDNSHHTNSHSIFDSDFSDNDGDSSDSGDDD